MRRTLAVVALCLALPLSAAEDAAAKHELIAELLEVLDVGRLTELALLPPPDADEKTTYVLAGLQVHLGRAELVELYEPFVANQLSMDELKSLIAFCKSAGGQKSAHFLLDLGRPGTQQWLVLASPKARELEAEYDRLHSDPMEITMRVLRTVATASEAYATDNDEYPRVTSMEELRTLLEPTYIRTMPSEDGWGTKLFYVTDGEHYRFVSAGSDRKFEWNRQVLDLEPEKVEPDRPGLDVIFQDGDFIQPPPPPPPLPPEP